MRMIEIYGRRWSAQFGEIPGPGRSSPAMGTWRRGLAGLTTRHLALGLRKCVRAGDPWPPSLPAFRAWCEPRPEDFGLPAPERALAEALGRPRNGQRPWSHPAVAAAARAARAAGRDGADTETVFRRAYRELSRRVMDGRPLDDPLPPEVTGPPPREAPARPEEAARHLAVLRRITHGAPRAGAPAPAGRRPRAAQGGRS